jgi:hypothetical protein
MRAGDYPLTTGDCGDTGARPFRQSAIANRQSTSLSGMTSVR